MQPKMADAVKKNIRAALEELRLRAGEARKLDALMKLTRSTSTASLFAIVAADGLRAIIGAIVRALRDESGRRVVAQASQVRAAAQVCAMDASHLLNPPPIPRRSSNPRLSQGCRTLLSTSSRGCQVRRMRQAPFNAAAVTRARTSSDVGANVHHMR